MEPNTLSSGDREGDADVLKMSKENENYLSKT
jgi:hypothetical protein